MEIVYTVIDSALGKLLVAATDAGICTVALADTEAPAVAALEKQFPKAALVRRERGELATWAKQVSAYVAGKRRDIDLPLDLHGTPFQQQVWRALQAIPYGTTCTYADVARRIRRPTAFRAVAQACGANPVGVLVPCHRVVRSDGTLGGYAGGLHRKVALLRNEGKLLV